MFPWLFYFCTIKWFKVERKCFYSVDSEIIKWIFFHLYILESPVYFYIWNLCISIMADFSSGRGSSCLLAQWLKTKFMTSNEIIAAHPNGRESRPREVIKNNFFSRLNRPAIISSDVVNSIVRWEKQRSAFLAGTEVGRDKYPLIHFSWNYFKHVDLKVCISMNVFKFISFIKRVFWSETNFEESQQTRILNFII